MTTRWQIVAFAVCLLLVLPAYLWNTSLFQLINEANTPIKDAVFGVVSGFGDGLVIALILFVLMLKNLRMGLAGLLAFILSGIVAQVLKRLFEMPRPPALFSDVHVLGDALQAHSFPSGHATSAGAMLMLCLLLFGVRDWRAWAGSLLFALAAYGRIYGGVHFPLDVAAGIGVGVLCQIACWQWLAVMPQQAWESSEWAWKVPAVLLLISAVVLGLGYHIQPSTASALGLVMPLLALLFFMQWWKGRAAHG